MSMLRCERHMVSPGIHNERGCDVVGGPAQAARYEVPAERPDLWDQHQRDHARWEADFVAAAKRRAEAEAAARAQAASSPIGGN